MQHDEDYVNNYTEKHWKAAIMRQQSLSALKSGMTLTITEDHDLLRFQSLACYDIPEIQKHLYHQEHDFPNVHLVYYLTKIDTIACSYNIGTYDLWFKTWEGYRLVLKLLLGSSYGLTIAAIITDIYQNNVGKMFDIEYLVALTSTMKALLYQYTASIDNFTVDPNPRVFQPWFDWQKVIELLWASFKERLTYG